MGQQLTSCKGAAGTMGQQCVRDVCQRGAAEPEELAFGQKPQAYEPQRSYVSGGSGTGGGAAIGGGVGNGTGATASGVGGAGGRVVSDVGRDDLGRRQGFGRVEELG